MRRRQLDSINPNKIVVYICIFFTIVFGIAIYIEWYVFNPMLGFFTLFFGVFIGFYSVKDIYDGKLSARFLCRRINGPYLTNMIIVKIRFGGRPKEATPWHVIACCLGAIPAAWEYSFGLLPLVFKCSDFTWH